MAKTLASILFGVGFIKGIVLASEIELNKYLEIAAYFVLIAPPIVSGIVNSDKVSAMEQEFYYKSLQNRKH
ncbi:MAG: hypothetical protein A2186_00560 [Candidatus Levybacteria bacterium RIFOXYA1_FULL_41_10]|nr:hypothetical protein [Candidatus Pacearchaeota archaeon]OGH57064.1 MAG: hypothetical protein A2186_00560 [Candidatus Levybacteria bacterium RIFOXYA1_FULL_41_10]